MKVALAYPSYTIDARPKEQIGLITFDYCAGSGWPNVKIGPDPELHHKRAVDEIVYQTPARIVPMSEESVLAVAAANEKLGIAEGLSLEAAARTVSRLLLREQLDRRAPHLNPRWSVDIPAWNGPTYVKAMASTGSIGVLKSPSAKAQDLKAMAERVQASAYIQVYWAATAGLRRAVTFEEPVPGTQHCISGICRDGVSKVFHPVEQTWNADGRVIVRYKKAKEDVLEGLREVAIEAAEALGLAWCGFNFEVRSDDAGQWKVIDAHARLGEDVGEYAKLVAGDPEALHPALQLVETLRV